MKITQNITVSDTAHCEIFSMFCSAVKGHYKDMKDSELQKIIDDACDSFANDYFNKGRMFERGEIKVDEHS